MKFSTIIGIVIVLALAGLIAYSYFFFEKPVQEKPIPYNNLSLAAYIDGKKAVVNYSIYSYGILKASGKTSSLGYVSEKLVANNSFDVYFESGKTYTKKISRAMTMDQIIRIEPNLDPLGNISISHTGQFWVDNPLTLDVKINGIVRNPILCLRWSMGLINVEIVGMDSLDLDWGTKMPKRMVADRCYWIYENSTSYLLHYTKFGDFNNNYINITIIDADWTPYSINEYESKAEGQNGEDIFVPDKSYTIR